MEIQPKTPPSPATRGDTFHACPLGHRFGEVLRSACRLIAITACGLRMMGAAGYHVVVHRTRFVEALAGQLVPSLSRLGTTAIKVGQLIASSPGSFPEALVRACSDLRDNVVTDQRLDIVALLDSELGERCRQFVTIDSEPIAAASVAQVHLGHLDDGRTVAIKVQRPGIAGTLSTDLRLLSGMTRITARLVPSLRKVNLTALVDSLSEQLHSELDFTSELLNAQLMETALAGTSIVVPHCFADLSTSNMLVMEFLPGEPLSVCASAIEAKGEGPEMARKVLRALLSPLTAHGIFHADMHGGNLLVSSEGQIGLVDFGSVTNLDREMTGRLVDALLALFERRFQEAACALMSMMDMTNADVDGARNELADVASQFFDQSVGEIPVGSAIKQLIAIGTSHGIVMPPTLLSLVRQMVFLDGITRELDPTFNFLDEGARLMQLATTQGPAREGERTVDEAEPFSFVLAA